MGCRHDSVITILFIFLLWSNGLRKSKAMVAIDVMKERICCHHVIIQASKKFESRPPADGDCFDRSVVLLFC